MTTKTKGLSAEARCARCGRPQVVYDTQWTCTSCGGANIESERIFDGAVDQALKGKLVRADELAPSPTPAGEIPLVAVLRSLNSMSSDGVRQLHERLSILSLVHEANRWRSQEAEHFAQVKRVLGSCGVIGLD
jgi:ribosomal protein L37E